MWTEQFYSGNGYVEFSGLRTGDDVNIDQFSNSAFDLTGVNSYINFKLAQHHLDDEENNTLEVFVSTDFDGSDVLAANWDKINVTIPSEDISVCISRCRISRCFKLFWETYVALSILVLEMILLLMEVIL